MNIASCHPDFLFYNSVYQIKHLNNTILNNPNMLGGGGGGGVGLPRLILTLHGVDKVRVL